jgi:hypothetical protein
MTVQRLRPLADVFRQGILACLVFMIPVFIVLFAMTVPDGPWELVLIAQVLISVAILISSWRFFKLAIWVSGDTIAERGFFRLHREFRTSEVGSLLFVNTYNGREIHPQLFVRDHSGALLIRMRGQFWSRDAMDQLVEALDVPVQLIEDPTTIAELRDTIPKGLYWFERLPVAAGFAFAAALACIGGITLLVLRFAGVMV